MHARAKFQVMFTQCVWKTPGKLTHGNANVPSPFIAQKQKKANYKRHNVWRCRYLFAFAVAEA